MRQLIRSGVTSGDDFSARVKSTETRKISGHGVGVTFEENISPLCQLVWKSTSQRKFIDFRPGDTRGFIQSRELGSVISAVHER